MSTVRVYTDSDTSPAVTIYGDSGDHSLLLRYLDGWDGTPDGKVALTERASGDGAHDVSADSILYSARTVAVDYRVLADSRDELLSVQHALLSLAHRQVRIRVTDDTSDLFAAGYVHEVSKDKSQQNLARQTETGTLTIVCPRPERLAWNPLQSQLFPVSEVQGGLRYSTVHELVSAWAGAANASTSTLSENGSVIATNLWKYNIIDSTSYFGNDNGKLSVANGVLTASGSSASSVFLNYTISDTPSTIVGTPYSIYLPAAGTYVLEADVLMSDNIPANTNLRYQLRATSGDSLNDIDTSLNTRWNDFPSQPSHGTWSHVELQFTVTAAGYAVYAIGFWSGVSGLSTSLQVKNLGCYEIDDYAAMQSLGIDWFSGDTYPLPTGKGLSYPLSYGTAGADSNVALLLNHGSSTAFPVLTVTGSFPSGIQIQWGGNALQYDGAIGAVPLILDSRSQTASMGGVDVSRNLSRRDFPTVPAAGSVSLRLMSAGTGWVTAVCRDTYI